MSATHTHSGQSHGDNYLNHSHGLWSWLSTLDHKRIGVMYLYTVMMFFLVGGLLALGVRTALWLPNGGMQQLVPALDPNVYNRLFTYHGAIMVFFVIIPGIPGALGNFVLPIMLGAKDVAFPRLNLASYYIFLLGAAVALFSLALGGADTGWTFYTPYSIRNSAAVISIVAGAFIAGFASILTGLNFVVSVHKLRAPGLTFSRLPLFVWALYATSIIQILATPVLAITLMLLIAENTLKIGIFDPALGGDPVLFQHFFWFYSHPAVYIMILPAMGVISEIIPVFSRKPIFGYKAIAASSFGIALIAFIVWGHHMFVAGQSELANFVFSLLTMLVAVPTGIKVFSWVGTMYRGAIIWKAPMLYAMVFLWLFTIGGLTGVFLGILALDIHLTDTYFVIAHFHYVMVGGTITGLLGGLHYWFPKMTGRMYSEASARLGAFLVLVGFNLTFFPQFIAGAQGMPRRYFKYLPEFTTMNQLSTIGAWVLGIGFVWSALYLIRAAISGPKVTDPNPWKALSMEWMAATPPPHENFKDTPTCTVWPYDFRSENV
jgi:cytochrome c oxidase subunit 1